MAEPIGWLREVWQVERATAEENRNTWPQARDAMLTDLDGKLAILDMYDQMRGNPNIHEDARTAVRRVIQQLARKYAGRVDFPPELQL